MLEAPGGPEGGRAPILVDKCTGDFATVGEIFFGDGLLRFCRGFLKKTGGWTWFFDGEFVVEAW